MQVKRRARRAAYRRGATNGWEWRQIGWYTNRPHVLRALQSQEIGRYESFRVIECPAMRGQKPPASPFHGQPPTAD